MFVLLMSALAFKANAAEITVVQAGQQYLSQAAEAEAERIKATPSLGREHVVKALKIKAGDEIVFKNLDKVTHNVFGADFDLQAQAAGSVVKQGFFKPGRQTIRCAIHPKMKFELDVEP